ncbi:MAG: nucleotidyltransferase [Gemmatimonadales bacterium]|nr:nucleotidyltransferase [Gemmatimonadales bacterium]MDZ4388117.1 nucleotidyltransferase [Gemmatimonadales bacterium]
MNAKQPYSRIAITLPPEDLAAADRLAKFQDRSRSWIIAEAIRKYAAAESGPARSEGIGPYRLDQLIRDMALTPERRVRVAEDTDRVSRYIGRVAEPQPEPPAGRVTALASVCSRLNDSSARYVVVGARALQLWGTSRATQDIDILIEPTVENAARVLEALGTIGFGFAREHLPEEVATKPVTIIGDSPRVDILTRAWNLRWSEAVLRATTFEVEGVSIPTASIEDLIASKRTGRLQDAADIELLEEIRRLRNEGHGSGG